MKIGIFQLNGCTKCRNEIINLIGNPELIVRNVKDYEEETDVKLIWCTDEYNLPSSIDIAIFSGYATSENLHCLQEIRKIANQVFTFGSCATDGGIFGLAYQKGIEIFPISKIISVDQEIRGCLASGDHLLALLKDYNQFQSEKLCEKCPRESTCSFLEEIVHQIDLQELDEKQCFNDVGYTCSGYIANNCQERCIDFGTPCRGCNPFIDDSSIRMLGMMGTLMGQMDVATEASSKGATDKLADEEDEISSAYSDVVGTFFRFTLANSPIPPGKIPSSGNIIADIMVGRPIEELPLITGMMGGKSFISMTIDILDAYEKGIKLELDNELKTIREQLLELEKKYKLACENMDPNLYAESTENIRKLAGNMNLSNLYFGGMKIKLDSFKNFDNFRAHPIPIQEGTYTSSSKNVTFTLDSRGIITNWESKNYEL
ncbi:MAG: hypothetical protein K9W44_12960 [Candidatus Lokiarchaeota archaeon]|nr:hypothetical protein [Candidatus Harpocratesius repetitus]